RAQQHTAEVPGDHRDHVRHLVAAQHLQHRDPGRAGGLAVIAGLLHPAVLPDHERRAVVPGLVVELAALQDEITSLVLGAHPLQCAQETGLLTSSSYSPACLMVRIQPSHPAPPARRPGCPLSGNRARALRTTLILAPGELLTASCAKSHIAGIRISPPRPDT